MNTHVIGNPIRKISSYRNLHKENIVLTVGRLIATKHNNELIRIFVGLNIPSWKLMIVGDDALKQSNLIKLKKLVAELHVENRIFFTGNRQDVDDL